MHLVERSDLRRNFQRYHKTFVGVIGARALLAGASAETNPQDIGQIARVQRLLGPIAAQLPELQTSVLDPSEKAHFLRFGEEVLKGILQLSQEYGLRPRNKGVSNNEAKSRPIPLCEPNPNNWSVAQTFLYIIQPSGSRVDISSLQLDEIHEPGAPRKSDKPFDPWVGQFGLDIYGRDPDTPSTQLLYEGRSPVEWHGQFQRDRRATGDDLLEMYKLSYALGEVQPNLR